MFDKKKIESEDDEDEDVMVEGNVQGEILGENKMQVEVQIEEQQIDVQQRYLGEHGPKQDAQDLGDTTCIRRN